MKNLKIDQIAYASYSEANTMAIKAHLGLEDALWVEDEVIADGYVNGKFGTNRAILLFNYDLGIETEILRYVEGPNYLEAQGIRPESVCHLGMHYTGEGAIPKFDASVIQRVETQSHTNPFLLKEGRKYRYTIYNTRYQYGVNYKVIERLH